jgi:hypothetical protein
VELAEAAEHWIVKRNKQRHPPPADRGRHCRRILTCVRGGSASHPVIAAALAALHAIAAARAPVSDRPGANKNESAVI